MSDHHFIFKDGDKGFGNYKLINLFPVRKNKKCNALHHVEENALQNPESVH